MKISHLFQNEIPRLKLLNVRSGKVNGYRENDCLVYHVIANRFLRGMVRALTATMLKIGRGKMSINQFREDNRSKRLYESSFAVPAQGSFPCIGSISANSFWRIISLKKLTTSLYSADYLSFWFDLCGYSSRH